MKIQSRICYVGNGLLDPYICSRKLFNFEPIAMDLFLTKTISTHTQTGIKKKNFFKDDNLVYAFLVVLQAFL